MFINKHISENYMIITTTKSYMSNYYFSKEIKKDGESKSERKKVQHRKK